MSTGITFSGFNSIDFNMVLTAIMQQESQPLQALQARQTALQTRATQLTTFSTKITALQTAANALSTPSDAASFKATSGDTTAIGVSSGTSAVPGRYDIVVSQLARAQVTASDNAAPDAETTTVATGGSITIGSETITLTGATTLRQLSEAINANADAPARASIVQSGPGAFKLVLTAKNTGAANAFTVTDGLTGGAFDLTFAGNAVDAADAQLTINNIAVTSASNTLDAAVPGSTITLYKQDLAKTIVVDVAEDPSALKTKLQSLVTAYNDIVSFITDQQLAKTDGAIGRDPIVRNLRNELRGALSQEFATGGPFKYLSQIGVQLTRAGTMEINEAVFSEAIKNGSDDIATLLAGTDATPGVLKSMTTMLKRYTQAEGFLFSAQTQITDQLGRLSTQVGRMQDRLALRRAALQQEFTAADAAMSALKNQSGSLQNVSL